MADLPPERLETCPPFTYVGLDVFGLWSITTRRTRGGKAESKQWVILFYCISRFEVIDSMDTSSCINALRCFFAIRGPVKQLRSDCNTNLIGACKELVISKDKPDTTVERFLNQQGCSWVFNPSHASHMGGSWECLIGVARRILDSMLLDQYTHLTHEVLCMLMAEVTAIINARPLIPFSNNPEDPYSVTINAPNPESWSPTSTRRFYRQRPPHQAVETSTMSRQRIAGDKSTCPLCKTERNGPTKTCKKGI